MQCPHTRLRISIHSPRTGRDIGSIGSGSGTRRFQSTRPARGETCHGDAVPLDFFVFQSTRPARGETSQQNQPVQQMQHFNPLAPHGARRRNTSSEIRNSNFNPLAPHGARRIIKHYIITRKVFQSTRPARGETPQKTMDTSTLQNFNPLAPHGARQIVYFLLNLRNRNFNPLAPHGARPCEWC